MGISHGTILFRVQYIYCIPLKNVTVSKSCLIESQKHQANFGWEHYAKANRQCERSMNNYCDRFGPHCQEDKNLFTKSIRAFHASKAFNPRNDG